MFTLLQRRVAPDFRLGAGAKARLAKPYLAMRHGTLERLRIGIGCDEVDAHHAFADHVVDGIAAGATDADDLDDGARIVSGFFFVDDFEHGVLLLKKTG